jgi:porphobilinogen synthase
MTGKVELSMSEIKKNLHRMKSNKFLRDLCSETNFTIAHFVQPLFTSELVDEKEKIEGLKDNFVMNIEDTIRQIDNDINSGVNNFLLFISSKSKSIDSFNLEYHQKVISSIKDRFRHDINLWTDVCLCSLTSHGHCCLFDAKGSIDLDKTLLEISSIALAYAEAGSDIIAPSDMMDGRTLRIRDTLDKSNFSMTPIVSYSTKFSSNFYGPFRNAANSTPSFGDRKQYQLDYRNRSEAIRASIRCAEEGADMLMVKPGMTSIDLIRDIKIKTGLMVGSYQVSGEYAGLCLSEERGLLNLENSLEETWHVMRRAEAQFIITYGARLAKNIGF